MMKLKIAALSLLLMVGIEARADVTAANAAAGANAEAGSLAVAGNKNVQQLNLPTNPAATTADVRTVPSLGGLGGWAFGTGAGPCLGPAETRQGGVQGTWAFMGLGGQYGEGTTNLDWGCVILRDMNAAQLMCEKGVKKACDDRDKLYEMLPGVTAIRAGSLPAYAKTQVVPAPQQAQAPAQQPAKKAEATAVPTSGPDLTDPWIRARLGVK